MNDTRTYDQLGAALRTMPYESRELLITTTYLMASELAMTFGWPLIAVDADGVADEIVRKLAERFDAIAEQKPERSALRAKLSSLLADAWADLPAPNYAEDDYNAGVIEGMSRANTIICDALKVAR